MTWIPNRKTFSKKKTTPAGLKKWLASKKREKAKAIAMARRSKGSSVHDTVDESGGGGGVPWGGSGGTP